MGCLVAVAYRSEEIELKPIHHPVEGCVSSLTDMAEPLMSTELILLAVDDEEGVEFVCFLDELNEGVGVGSKLFAVQSIPRD